MMECMTRPYLLADKLSHLFNYECRIDAVLSISMYYLNQLVNSERSSIFLTQNWNQDLTVFSSLDLKKNEISIPESCGVTGWVFAKRFPVIVNNAYEDKRFYKKIDEMTGFHTHHLICTPLIDYNDHCIGTLQSLNSKRGYFNSDDLELLKLAARMMTIAITNSRRYKEMAVTNKASRKLINQMIGTIGNLSSQTIS